MPKRPAMAQLSQVDVVKFLAGLDAEQTAKLLAAAAQHRDDVDAPEADGLAGEAPVPATPADTDAADEDAAALCSFCADDGGGGELVALCDCCSGEEWDFGDAALDTGAADSEATEAASEELLSALEVSSFERAAAAVAAGGSLTQLGEAGWAPMHWAVQAVATQQSAADDCGQVGMCECCTPKAPHPRARAFLRALLRTPGAKAAVDVRSADGATPLMFAADGGDLQVCLWLLSLGADASMLDDDGDTAAAWARARGYGQLAARLERAAKRSPAATRDGR